MDDGSACFNFSTSSEEESNEFNPTIYAQKTKTIDLTVNEAARDFAGNKDYCDVNLVLATNAGDEIGIRAHSIILAANSGYFRAALSPKYKEGQMKTIRFDGIRCDSFKILLDMLYGMPFDLNCDNIFDIYPLADYFMMEHAIEVCLEFIKSRINISQVLELWKMAKRTGQYSLTQIAKEFTLKNFSKLMKDDSSGLYDLSAKQLLSILRQDDLKIRNERLLVDLIYKWALRKQSVDAECTSDYPNLERFNDEGFCGLLFVGVRFGKMSSPICGCFNYSRKRLKETCTCGNMDTLCAQHAPSFEDYPYIEAHIQDCKSCADNLQLLRNQLQYQQFPEKSENLGKEEILSLNWYRPRSSYEALIAVGGWNENAPTGIIQVYNSQSNTWKLYNGDESHPRAYHGLAELDGSIYCIGGFNGTERLNTLLCLDIKNRKWIEKAPMHERRCYVSVVTCANCIYAIGGHDGNVRLRTVEKYDPERNQWDRVPNMQCVRSDACAAARNRNIYVVGGFDGDAVHNSVETFNIDTEVWSFIAALNSPRSGVRAICCQGKLCVIGGFNGERRMKTMEVYNDEKGVWEIQAGEMTIARSNFGVETFGKYLAVLGGYDDERRQTATNCEIYCFKEAAWSRIAPMPIKTGCSALAVVTLRRVNVHREFGSRLDW